MISERIAEILKKPLFAPCKLHYLSKVIPAIEWVFSPHCQRKRWERKLGVGTDLEKEIKFGGKGAILEKSLTITSPSGETHTVSWGKGNVTTTNLFIAEKAAGTWSVYMTGTNIASPNLGSAFIGGTKYSSVKMKVSYILED